MEEHFDEVDIKCADCSTMLKGPKMIREMFPSAFRCPPCEDKAKVKFDEGKEREKALVKREKWEELCPKLYQNTDINHKGFPVHIWEKIKGRKHSERGIMLRGDSRTGKTRLMFKYLEHLFFSHRVKPMILYAGELSLNITNLLDNTRMYKEWEERLKTVPLLFLDDLFAEKYTERSEDVLFRIIDTRTRDMLPIYSTTQKKGVAIEKGFQDKDRAIALTERLREFCDIIPI